MMKPLSDEVLAAYADDELPAAERAAVERRLAHDAEARDRLAAFTSTGQWLARAYDDTLREPVPEGLLAAIHAERDGAPATRSAAAPGRTFWQWLRVHDWGVAWPALGGMGVGLATGIALLLAWPGDGRMAPDVDRLVSRALETAAGGEPRVFEVAGGRLEITPIGTMLTDAGEICREFTRVDDTAAAAPAVSHGIACRASDGSTQPAWQTVARVEFPAPEAETAAFGLASGAPQVLLEALLETLGPARPLSPEAERQLLEAGWQ